MSEQIIIPGPGDLLANEFELVDELGRGSYGVVFRARQIGTSKEVAIKTLLPQAFLDPEIVARFSREAQVVSRLEHQNIIRVVSYGQSNGLIYMAMEYIEGRPLAHVIQNDTPLHVTQAKALIRQLLSGLDHAHAQGIVHRDLKPDNILLWKADAAQGREQEMLKILDFGIAKLVLGPNDGKDFKTLTQAGHVLGTPHYMSPEQISGDTITHQADLYSAGIILYELLAGYHPYHDAQNSTAVMVKHLHEEPGPLPFGLEQTALGEAVRWALAKQPLDRIPDAKTFLELIDRDDDTMLEEATRPYELQRLNPPTPGSAAYIDDAPTMQLDREFVQQARTRHPNHITQPNIEVAESDRGFESIQIAAQASAQKPRGPSRFLITAILFLGAFTIFGLLIIIGQQRIEPTPQTLPSAEPTPTLLTRTLPPPTRPATLAPKPDMGEPVDMALDAQDLGKAKGKPKDPEPSKPPKNTRPPKEDKPTRPKNTRKVEEPKVTLSIQTNPSGATVYINGKLLVGPTPLTHLVDRDDKKLKITLEKSGYENTDYYIAPVEDQKIDLKLKRGRVSIP